MCKKRKLKVNSGKSEVMVPEGEDSRGLILQSQARAWAESMTEWKKWLGQEKIEMVVEFKHFTDGPM